MLFGVAWRGVASLACAFDVEFVAVAECEGSAYADIGPEEPIKHHGTIPPGTKLKAKSGATLEYSSWIELVATGPSGEGGIQPRCQFEVKYAGKTFQVWDDSPISAPEGATEPNPDHWTSWLHS